MKNKIFLILAALSFIYCQSKVYTQGERLYNMYCSNCHGAEGEGLKSLYPPLNQSDYYANNMEKVPCIITQGLEEGVTVNGKTYVMPMEAIPDLTDVDITNIMNYINTAWDNDLEELTLADVKKYLENCEH